MTRITDRNEKVSIMSSIHIDRASMIFHKLWNMFFIIVALFWIRRRRRMDISMKTSEYWWISRMVSISLWDELFFVPSFPNVWQCGQIFRIVFRFHDGFLEISCVEMLCRVGNEGIDLSKSKTERIHSLSLHMSAYFTPPSIQKVLIVSLEFGLTDSMTKFWGFLSRVS